MGAILELLLHLSYLRNQQMDLVENLEDTSTVSTLHFILLKDFSKTCSKTSTRLPSSEHGTS